MQLNAFQHSPLQVRPAACNLIHGSGLLIAVGAHTATCKFTEIPASALGSLIKPIPSAAPREGPYRYRVACALTSSLASPCPGGLEDPRLLIRNRLGSDESRIWPVALHDLDLGPPRDHCHYISRGGTRLCCASLGRRYGLAPWPRHLQSTKAHRPDGNNFAAGGASFPALTVPVWLREAGPG